MAKTELVNKGSSYLEHEKDNIQVFSYKGKYVYMDQDGTHFKKSLPSDVEDDVWKLCHMRSEPFDKIVERLKHKRISFGSLKVVYFDDHNIFTRHGNRMEVGEFLSTLFYDMMPLISDLSEEEFRKYTDRVNTMTGFVMTHYPNLSVTADLRDSWAVELYKLDIGDYTNSGVVGSRLEDMCKIIQEMGKEEAIRSQFGKTIDVTFSYPLDTQPGGVFTRAMLILEHYVKCIKFDPHCWQPDLFKLLEKYTDKSDRVVDMLKEHAKEFRGIANDLN